MKHRKLCGVAIVLMIVAWPPVFFLYFAQDLQTLTSDRHEMTNFDLQQILSAQRWIIDIPRDKDGWFLGIETERDGVVKTSGGSLVRGGTRIVLLTRRDLSSNQIEYAWYSTPELSGSQGIVADPLVGADVIFGPPDNLVQIGEAIYCGGRSSSDGFSSNQKADFEVRVALTPPPT